MVEPIFSFSSLDAAVFDIEYARWLEEHHRITCELRAAVQEHLPENELRLFVDNCLAHFDEAMNLKSMVAKSDVFHIVSGMWKTPAERCFMWIGGFRPSELIKVPHVFKIIVLTTSFSLSSLKFLRIGKICVEKLPKHELLGTLKREWFFYDKCNIQLVGGSAMKISNND